jgi:predicted nucleotidyltransferase
MDEKELLRSLSDHKVKFLVIGAWALPQYGIERMTQDIDILFEPTIENARRLFKALQKVGYDGIQDIPMERILQKKVLARGYLLNTDTHPFVAGSSFADAWKTRKRTEIKGQRVFVPSLDCLITMKEAAGRPKDMLDLERLQALKKRKKAAKKTRRK